MTDFPNVGSLPLFISTALSRWGAWPDYHFLAASGIGGSNAAGAANTAAYMPIAIPWPYPVKRVWWANGAGIAGNVDFGIYTPSGARLYSTGSTAQSGASVLQYVTPTPFILPAGKYYFALVASNVATATFWSVAQSAGASAFSRVTGVMQQATALPLPATATFASCANVVIMACGVTRTVSGF